MKIYIPIPLSLALLVLSSSRCCTAQESTRPEGPSKFPALEAIPYQKQKITTINAREILISENVSFSSGYFFPTNRFVPPTIFTITIYGYHNKPQWNELKSITLKFAGLAFTSKPHHLMSGPTRDRSADLKSADYFERLSIEVPPHISRQIADNRGVLVSAEAPDFPLSISASKMDRFKQLVDSVTYFSKAFQATSPKSTQPRQSLASSTVASNKSNSKKNTVIRLTARQRKVAKSAVKELRTIDSKISRGMTLAEYRNTVRSAKRRINGYLPLLPESKIKDRISGGIDLYVFVLEELWEKDPQLSFKSPTRDKNSPARKEYETKAWSFIERMWNLSARGRREAELLIG